jgi:lipoprotein NlpD
MIIAADNKQMSKIGRAGKRHRSFFYLALIFCQLLALSACGNFKSDTLFQSQSRKAVRYGEYEVQKGDSLYSIAWRFKRDYKELAKINKIKSPYTIRVGQKIKLANYQDEIPSKGGYTGKSVVQPSKQKYTPTKTTTYKQKSWVRGRANTKRNRHTKNSISWQWPASGKLIQTFSFCSVGKKGIQISGNPGDAVKAAADGKVVYSGNSLVGYGNLVIVKHDEVFLTAYAHNRRVIVKEGQNVTRGQKIAEIGASGTDRNKLHFEIRKEGKPVNPVSYLPRR